MKRGLILFLAFVFLIFTFIPYLNSEEPITGEVVTTGEVTDASLAITVSIFGGPSLRIISPENETYLKNESLLVNYAVSGEDAVWYNFDSTSNTTIFSSFFFNISQGSHTLYLFANNSDGNTTSKDVTFYVNSTRFIILYSEYSGSTKGTSTDFNSSTYEEIQSLSNIILENTGSGKILFNQAINLTDDLNNNDNILDLDSNTNVSENRIELNSTALPNFNKNATLWLYNLTFSNPRILKDEVVCPSTICVQNSYSGGTLSFNVTGFSVYSAEEAPEEPVLPTPPGGGGGGLIFTTDVDEIKVSLKQGEIKTEEIKIKNQKNAKVSFSVYSDMEDLVRISEKSFELESKEEKTILIDFIAREDNIPELYLGNLFIEASGIKKIILIIMEIESKEALFDVKVNIPKQFSVVEPGGEFMAEISIFNIVETGEVDVFVEYRIVSENGVIILKDKETSAVDRQKDYTKEFQIPENVDGGKYIFYTTVTYGGKTASSSAVFEIKEKGYLVLIAMIILIVLLSLIIYLIRHKRLPPKIEGLPPKIEDSDSRLSQKQRFRGPLLFKR